jgi:GNAT superfamily N-acetyltransferase
MAAMDIHTRSANLEDDDMIANLVGQLGYPSSTHEIRERLDGILEDHDQAVFVAESVEKRVVGWVHVFIAQRLIVEPFVEVGGLIVGEEQRGSGIGKSLLVAAEAWAESNRLTTIRVRSNSIREGALRFYERLGYRRTKQQNVFFKNLNCGNVGNHSSE